MNFYLLNLKTKIKFNKKLRVKEKEKKSNKKKFEHVLLDGGRELGQTGGRRGKRDERKGRRALVSRATSALKRSFLISCHHFNGLSYGLIWGMRVNCHYLFKPKSIPATGTILGFF